jgi:hypothetical protein
VVQLSTNILGGLLAFIRAIFAMINDKAWKYWKVINLYNKEWWLGGDYLLLLRDLELYVIITVNLCVNKTVAVV